MSDLQRLNSNGVAGVLANLPRPHTQRLKILSLGSAEVGKSCIIKRYCEERFIPKYISTIGIDYGVKKVNVQGFGDVRVNFWDVAGAKEFYEIRNEFYKDSQGVILVYDVTDPGSFLELEDWLSEAKKNNLPSTVATCVCANKCDLNSSQQRKVTEAEGKKWAAQKGFAYFETSANSGANISSMMDWVFKEAMKR